MVRTERLELSHLSILEPKSSASTNSATSAVSVRRLEKPFSRARIIPYHLLLPRIACVVSSASSPLY